MLSADKSFVCFQLLSLFQPTDKAFLSSAFMLSGSQTSLNELQTVCIAYCVFQIKLFSFFNITIERIPKCRLNFNCVIVSIFSSPSFFKSPSQTYLSTLVNICQHFTRIRAKFENMKYEYEYK